MPRQTLDQKLATLQQKKTKLEAQIGDAKAKVRAQKRKQDTRRKIIVGALCLEHATIDPEFRATISKLLNEHVKRPQDRALFSLLETDQNDGTTS